MDELIKYRRNALQDGLCDEWDSMWASCHGNKEKLMRLALMQQSFPHLTTFCNDGRGLSKEYLMTKFKDYINTRVFRDCEGVEGYTYEMFVGMEGSLELCVDVSYFMWAKDLYVTIPRAKAPNIYIANQSNVTLSLDGFDAPIIHMYDNSVVKIDDCDERSRVIVYKYSKDAIVERGKYCLGDVRVFDKELRLQL